MLKSVGVASEQMSKITRLVQREMKTEWMDKFLTPEERKTMRKLTERAYSEEAVKALMSASQQETTESFESYRRFRNELTCLVRANVSPDSSEALQLASDLITMNERRSNGNPEILAEMRKAWEAFQQLPEDKKPSLYNIPDDERLFIREACINYYRYKAHQSE